MKIKTMRIIGSSIALSWLVTGCASKYQLNQDTIAYQANLTESKAMSVISKQSKASVNQRGLCLSIQSFTLPRSSVSEYEIKDSLLYYEAKFSKEISSTLNNIKNDLEIAFPDTDQKVHDKNLNSIQLHAMKATYDKEKSFKVDRDKPFTVTVSVPMKYEVDFKNLESVRIFSGIPYNDSRSCLVESKGKYFVWLTPAANPAEQDHLTPNSIRYNISERNLDHFLASLSYLSPKARLIEGAGF